MSGTAALPLIRAALQSAPALAPKSSKSTYRYLTDYEVASWQVTSSHARPNAGVSVTYRVNLICPDKPMHVTTVASTEKIPRGQAMVVRCDPKLAQGFAGQTKPLAVSVWTFPHDPLLAGLPWATNSVAVAQKLGLQDARLKPVVYRPTRRAMIKVSSHDRPHSWVKVLQPERAQGLHAVLNTLEGSAFPFPPLLAAPAAGVVVLAHGQGESLANWISKQPHRAARLFDAIKATLDALPNEVCDLPSHKSWTDRRAHYAAQLAQMLPDLAPEIESLVAHIDAHLNPDQPIVATHGDFFEANLLTDGQKITSVLDLDSIGPGLRADDYACLLAHVSVLPFLSPQKWVSASASEPWRSRLNQFLPGKRCPAYPESETVLEAWRLQAERECDPADLCARCAAVTLSLASAASLKWGEGEARARYARAWWWAQLAAEHA